MPGAERDPAPVMQVGRPRVPTPQWVKEKEGNSDYGTVHSFSRREDGLEVLVPSIYNGEWHTGHSVDLAVRFPVGLDYLFDGAPVDVFFELAPTLDLVPDTWFEVDFGLGGRYWF